MVMPHNSHACQFIQLRRDLFMTGAMWEINNQQALRHAPPLNCPDLFPHKTLFEMSEQVKRSCETSLIVQTFRISQNKRQFDNKQKLLAKNANESQRSWGRSETELTLEPSVIAQCLLYHLPQRLTKRTRMTNLLSRVLQTPTGRGETTPLLEKLESDRHP